MAHRAEEVHLAAHALRGRRRRRRDRRERGGLVREASRGQVIRTSRERVGAAVVEPHPRAGATALAPFQPAGDRPAP